MEKSNEPNELRLQLQSHRSNDSLADNAHARQHWLISIRQRHHCENTPLRPSRAMTSLCVCVCFVFIFLLPFGKTYSRTSCVFQLGDEAKRQSLWIKGLRVQKIFQRARGPRLVLIRINNPNPTVTSLFLFMFLSLRNSFPPCSLRLFTLPLQWWAPLCHFSFMLHTAQAHKFILINSSGDKSCCGLWRRRSMFREVTGQLNSLREDIVKTMSTWPCHEWKYDLNPQSPVGQPEVLWPASTAS